MESCCESFIGSPTWDVHELQFSSDLIEDPYITWFLQSDHADHAHPPPGLASDNPDDENLKNPLLDHHHHIHDGFSQASWQHLVSPDVTTNNSLPGSDAAANLSTINVQRLQTHHHGDTISGLIDDPLQPHPDKFNEMNQSLQHHDALSEEHGPNYSLLLAHHHQTTDNLDLEKQAAGSSSIEMEPSNSGSIKSKDRSNESSSSSSSSSSLLVQHVQNAADDSASLSTPSSEEDTSHKDSSEKPSSTVSATQATSTGKAAKKRIRKQKKAPVSVLSANKSNFKDIVHKLTGIRAASSYLQRFGYGNSGAHAFKPHPSRPSSEAMAAFACSQQMFKQSSGYSGKVPLPHFFSFPQRSPVPPSGPLFQPAIDVGHGTNNDFDLDWSMASMLNHRLNRNYGAYLQPSAASSFAKLYDPIDDSIFLDNPLVAMAGQEDKDGAIDELMASSMFTEDMMQTIMGPYDADSMVSAYLAAPELVTQQ